MGKSLSTLYLVIPVLNEAPNLPRLSESLRVTTASFQDRYRTHIIFVDDGSIDDTIKAISANCHDLETSVIRHEINQGPGYAFGSAFEYLGDRLKPGDWVCTMEGDNTSNINLLNQMFQRTGEGYEVIFASPYMYGGGFTNTDFFRRFFSFMANTYVREFLGIPGIFTVSSFFRLYKAEVLQALQKIYGKRIIASKGFECMIELSMKLVFRNTKISEVPMVLDSNKRIGKSKMKKLKTVWGYIQVGLNRRKWWKIYRDKTEKIDD